MSDQDKVISLAQRRAKRQAAAPPQPALPPDSPVATEGAPAAAQPTVAPKPLPGQMVWLRCPACGTLEYSELLLPGGRRHKCGTIVEEAVVDLDVRAEWTVAGVNLSRIDALGRYLEHQRERFTEYQRRLELIAGQRPEPYPLNEDMVKTLPVAEVDALGLFISKALHDPAARFNKKDKA
jgi:hypothetical protein